MRWSGTAVRQMGVFHSLSQPSETLHGMGLPALNVMQANHGHRSRSSIYAPKQAHVLIGRPHYEKCCNRWCMHERHFNRYRSG